MSSKPSSYPGFGTLFIGYFAQHLGQGIGRSQAFYQHWTTQTQKKKQTDIQRVGFEPTIPVHDSDRALSAISGYETSAVVTVYNASCR
jgi:hypothetical protein